MKIQISFEGDLYEDSDDIATIIHARTMRAKIDEVRAHIRSKVKWSEITENESKLLEEVNSMLYIEGLD